MKKPCHATGCKCEAEDKISIGHGLSVSRGSDISKSVFTDLQAVVALPEELQALLVEGADRLGEVAEGGLAVEVEAAAGVVRQDPGEHRVLVQVIVRAPGKRVELRSKIQTMLYACQINPPIFLPPSCAALHVAELQAIWLTSCKYDRPV